MRNVLFWSCASAHAANILLAAAQGLVWAGDMPPFLPAGYMPSHSCLLLCRDKSLYLHFLRSPAEVVGKDGHAAEVGEGWLAGNRAPCALVAPPATVQNKQCLASRLMLINSLLPLRFILLNYLHALHYPSINQVKLEKTRLEPAGEGKDQKAIGTGAPRDGCTSCCPRYRAAAPIGLLWCADAAAPCCCRPNWSAVCSRTGLVPMN